MRDGKGKFYKVLKIDKTTRKAIKLYNEIVYFMRKTIEGKKNVNS